MEQSRGTITGNFHGQNGNNVRVEPMRKFSGNSRNIFRGEPTRPLCFELTTSQWNETASGAISQHMRDEGLTLKELAQKIGCSDRTAENYVQGRTAPAGLHFLRAIAVIPEFEAEVRRVSAMAADCDPHTNQAALELIRAAQKFVDVRARTSEAQAMGSPLASSPPYDAKAAGEEIDNLTGDLFSGVH